MATVTKPIALDESLNTTELSSRNVADVLAQELQAVATAIGGIAVPSADHVSYDNSVSGLSATDVQNALDEIVSDIPTVNNGTLTIQQNGTSIGSFSANTASNVTANIKTPTADKKTATTEFNTANGGLLSKCMIDLAPVQSGSGDPSPDNVRPISGHTEVDLYNVGKNLAEYDNENNPNRDAFNYSSDTAESLIATRLNAGGAFIVQLRAYVIAGKTYTFSFGKYALNGTTQSTANIYIYSDNLWGTAVKANWNVNKTGSEWVSTYTGEVVFGIFNSSSAGTMIELEKFQLELGSTATPYEPYLGHLYQVQIGSTVYGGYDEIVSGSGKNTFGYKDLGSLSYTKYDTAQGTLFRASLSDIKQISSSSTIPNVLCSQYKTVSNSARTDKTISLNPNTSAIDIIDNNYSDTTTFKNAMSGVQLVYELSTPTDITHDSTQIETLAGQNNLSTPLDGQSIETNGVEYKELFTFADVKEYVDKKIPDAPTTDGTYTLQAVVSGGVPTYSWV